MLVTDEQILGDIGRAAKRVGIRRELLDKWMSTPEIASGINRAARESAGELLFLGKVSRQLQTDSLASAKLASQDLNAFKSFIGSMAEKGDKKLLWIWADACQVKLSASCGTGLTKT